MNTSLCLKLRLGKQMDTDLQEVGAIDPNRPGGSVNRPYLRFSTSVCGA